MGILMHGVYHIVALQPFRVSDYLRLRIRQNENNSFTMQLEVEGRPSNECILPFRITDQGEIILGGDVLTDRDIQRIITAVKHGKDL
jgi:hypothetical protein